MSPEFTKMPMDEGGMLKMPVGAAWYINKYACG